MLTFSLIICTRGRPAFLVNALSAAAGLRYPAFELIVVCDPSDLETSNCLARHAPRARRADCPAANLARARNIGLSLARGEIVAFLDDDAIPEPDWLDQLAAAYLDPGVNAAGGFIRARDGIKYQSRIVLVDAFGADHQCRRMPRRLPAGWFLSLTGTNFSARRAALMAIHGFDENYNYFLEETDFLCRLQRAGGRVALAPAAEVQHCWAPSDVRAESGAPTSLLGIARSKAYFCHVNRQNGAPLAGISKALASFVRQKRSRMKTHRRAGRLGAADSVRLETEMQAGIQEGKILAGNGRALPPALAQDDAEFEPYKPPGQLPRRRLCILMSGAVFDSPQWDWIFSLASAAFEVTVMVAGAAKTCVCFRQGVWVHQLAPSSWPFKRTDHLLLAELRRISQRRGFQVIHVASDDAALERTAESSGLPRFKPASFPARREFA